MSGIFPLREAVDLGDDRDPRLIDLDEDVADEVFDALSSRTTREIFAQLHASPQTASDLAEVTDTSVQNARYHLQKLVAADLVEVVDTWYSERGTEMKVYAPTDESLVLFAGRDKEGALRTLLKRVVGVLVALLPVSAIVAWLADRFAGPRSDTSFQGEGAGDAGGGAGAADAGEQTPEPGAGTEAAVETKSGDDGAGAAGAESGDSDGVGGDGGSGGGDGADATPGDAGAGGGGGGDAVTPTADAPTPKSETLDAAGNATLRTNASGTVNGSTPAPETVDVAGTTPSPTPNPTARATDVMSEATATPSRALEATDAAVGTAATGIDPALVAGLSFFFGGVFVLALVGVAWYWWS